MAFTGALFEMNSLSFSETSKTIANSMMIPSMKKKVLKNLRMMYLSRILNIYNRCLSCGISCFFQGKKVPASKCARASRISSR